MDLLNWVAFLRRSSFNAVNLKHGEAQQMKRLILSFAMLTVVLSLGTGCATSKHKEAGQPAVAAPAPAPAPPEVVTPPVTLPPEENMPPSNM